MYTTAAGILSYHHPRSTWKPLSVISRDSVVDVKEHDLGGNVADVLDGELSTRRAKHVRAVALRECRLGALTGDADLCTRSPARIVSAR
jgi:hypothetical protein